MLGEKRREYYLRRAQTCAALPWPEDQLRQAIEALNSPKVREQMQRDVDRMKRDGRLEQEFEL